MNSRQAELESRVLEVTQLYENERESSKNHEQLLRSKISQLSSDNTQLEGDKTGRMTMQWGQFWFWLTMASLSPSLMLVLADEIQDLKLCLQSADRELVEAKAELRQEKEQAKSKSAELFLRVCFMLTSLPTEVTTKRFTFVSMEQIGDLEQQMSAKTAEGERALEDLQILQVCWSLNALPLL